MRIALDVDNTLAATLATVVDLYNREDEANLSVSDFSSWDFQENPLSFDEYAVAADAAWGHPDQIPPSSPTITDGVRALDAYGDIDIVTGREGREQEMQQWLEWHGIREGTEYRAFITDQYKARLDYDLYIDDNPRLATVTDAVVHRQPYNKHVNEVAVDRATWEDGDIVSAVAGYAAEE